MTYKVELTPPALKQMGKLDRLVRERIWRKLEQLENDPRPSGYKHLTGQPGLRIRVGDYRVLYIVDDAAKEVWVHNVAHRREVYDR